MNGHCNGNFLYQSLVAHQMILCPPQTRLVLKFELLFINTSVKKILNYIYICVCEETFLVKSKYASRLNDTCLEGHIKNLLIEIHS